MARLWPNRERSVVSSPVSARSIEPTAVADIEPDFVAIDFETANETRGSACAIGLAAVKNGDVARSWTSLIDPELPFNPYNSMVNGLDEVAVRGAPTFPQLWPIIAATLDGARVVAHNASFDVSVLRNAAARYELEGGPSFDLFCSYRLSKVVWNDRPSYSLGYLAPSVGIEFEHHEAGEDAVACALLTTALLQAAGASTLDELIQSVGSLAGRITPDSFLPFSSFADRGRLTAEQGRDDADPTHPLYGRSICFTGTLMSMSRREAMARVTEVGCDFKNGVSQKLDYLVIGDADFVKFADGWETGKLKKATALRAEGVEIEILPERTFLELLVHERDVP